MKHLVLLKFIAPVIILYIHYGTSADNFSPLCTKKFCEDATVQNPCKALPKQCNTTNGGIMMLEPSLCNCCEFCLVYLEEGDDCVADQMGQPLHEYICGPGLGCDDETHKCVPLTTSCTLKQRDFDQSQKNGTWGFTQMRPLCDARGEYYPAHCIGSSICYCVNPQGERIFGEAVYTGPVKQQSMLCECSIANWKADQLAEEMGITNIPVHCLEDGSYDLLQCNDDNCRCLNADTKTPDNNDDLIPEINLMENRPECFDPMIHTTGKYKRECEQKLEEMMLEIQLLKDDGITPIGLRLPNCQYDGYYDRVYVTDDSRKRCVDPDGNTLGESVPIGDTLSENMDCNCARTRWMLEREGQTELPICCDNGNFREMQCRRGKCYCVDCNGNQLGTEVDEDDKYSLNCKDDPTSCAICTQTPSSPIKKLSFVNKEWDPSTDINHVDGTLITDD